MVMEIDSTEKNRETGGKCLIILKAVKEERNESTNESFLSFVFFSVFWQS